MAPDILCSETEYIVHLVTIIIPGILLFVFVIPILAIRKMNRAAKLIYISGQQYQSDQTMNERSQINNIKSYYGFFFSGLKLGSETFRVEQEVHQGIDSQKDQLQGDTAGPGAPDYQTFGQKVGKMTSMLMRPVRGGVMVFTDSTQRIQEGEEYVVSFYHWEFILHI